MGVIGEIIGLPLGYLMYFCYWLVNNYGWGIILFALLSKIIFFPVSVSVQKNSLRLIKLQPSLKEIKQRYSGEKEKINEEQYNLFRREKYSPLKGSLPLLLQFLLIIGMINVMYNPLKYLLHLDAGVVDLLLNTTNQLYALNGQGAGQQLLVVRAVQDPANAEAFAALLGQMPSLSAVLPAISAIDLRFFGINLGLVPSVTQPSLLWLVPIAAVFSAFALSSVQIVLNPVARQQGFFGTWGLTILMMGLSLYFTLVVPAGVGVYWTASNLFSIAAAFLLNAIYNPKKAVDPALLSRAQKSSRAEKAAAQARLIELKNREGKDYQRFFKKDNTKQLVFFSLSSGQYKYFQTVIEYILEHSELIIHYVTNDPNDAIFKMATPRIIPYYIGPRKSMSLMLKMDADMVIMTAPNLQKYHIKRSVVRDDIEYVYIFHTVASMHMTLQHGAVDHYDTVFCVGIHHVEEIRKTEQLYGLAPKRLVKGGYGVIDKLLAAYAEMPKVHGEKPQILIAPSWQADCILDSCIDELLNQLVCRDYRIIVRPHPEYIKRFPEKMQAIRERWENKAGTDVVFEMDFIGNETIYQSDILMTDWSNIAFEFSYCTRKPSIFINTPMKVMNPEYEKLGITPLDITLRDKLGVSVEPAELGTIRAVVDNMLQNREKYREVIDATVEEYMFFPGRSGEAGGKYIIKQLTQAPY